MPIIATKTKITKIYMQKIVKYTKINSWTKLPLKISKLKNSKVSQEDKDSLTKILAKIKN
jgi:hypothetical protein